MPPPSSPNQIRPQWLGRVALVALGVAGAAADTTALVALGPSHAVIFGCGLIVTVGLTTALLWGKAGRHHPVATALACLLAFTIAILAVQPASTQERNRRPASAGPSAHSNPAPELRKMRSIPLPSRPRAMAWSSPGIWIGLDQGFGQLNDDRVRLVSDVAETAAIAAFGDRATRTTDEGAFETRTSEGHVIGPAFRYSEAGGVALVTPHASWLCNPTHAKVERIDSVTGSQASLPVPDAPALIGELGDQVVVGTKGGHLVRFSEASGSWQKTEDIAADPTDWVVTSDSLYVLHGPDRYIQPYSLRGSELVARESIRVPGGAVSIEFGSGSLWVLLATSDRLLRLDPDSGRRQRVVETPEQPVDLLVHERLLAIAARRDPRLVIYRIRRLR